MKLHLVLLLTFTLLFTACGGGGSSTSDTNKIALAKIEAYANDHTNPAPTIQDYIDAGVTGVTAENLAEINAIVDDLESEDVDTVEEINALVRSLDINIVPVANEQNITLNEDTSKALTLTASDADGDTLTYSIVTQPTHGILGGTAPSMTYTPMADYFGDDSFTFKVNDGTVDSAVQTVSITVTYVPETSTMAVKKTGQLLSYNKVGDEVADGSIKDDGFYQKGVEPSYTRDDATEIVTDHITNLQWQDNEEAKTVQRNWLGAKDYCTNLNLGGYGDWRLPSVVELQNIVVDGKYYPAIDTTAFVNYISNNYLYWSSTTHASGTNYAWGVDFYGGYTGHGNKSLSLYVRCVRAGQ